MKIFNYIKLAFMSMTLLIMAGACTDGFEEANTNPNGPVAIPGELLIPAVVERTSDRLYSTFVGGDMGNCWAQHWAKVQYNDEERYQPRGTVLDAIWNDLYAGSLTDAQLMLELGETEGNANIQGIAKVLLAYNYGLLTDMYGDVPFTEAIKAKEGINNPSYTAQEEIYPALIAMLSEADALLGTGGAVGTSADILYGGDVSKWKKFANSLKFRTIMRMSGRAGFSMAAELQSLVTAGNMFSSTSDEAKLVYLSASPNTNPVFNSVVAGNRGEFKVCEVLVDQLLDTSDPRLDAYVQKNADGMYRGKPAGISNVPNDDFNYENVSSIGNVYLQPESAGYMMSYSELEFLIAEAAHNGFITENAAPHYDAGIIASMDVNGISSADYASYLTNAAYSTSTGTEQIATQKWLSLFGQGVEAWTEWRRTGFPALTPAIEGLVSEVPSRYSYPPSEQSLNNDSYTAAVAAQGADVLTTKVWWNK